MRTIEELFLRYREAGDVTALGSAFDRTASALFRLALTLSHDAAAAEDALQETYLAAIQHAGRWDAARPLVPWLTGILRHQVSEQRRRAARRPRSDTPEIAQRNDPGDVVAREELTEAARRALEDLPEPYRLAALLRWQHGLEPAEIAHLTHQRPGTVRVTLHRALKRLKRKLGAALSVLPGVGSDGAPRGLSSVRAEVLGEAGALSSAPLRGAAVAVVSVVIVAALVAVGVSFARSDRVPHRAPSDTRTAGVGDEESSGRRHVSVQPPSRDPDPEPDEPPTPEGSIVAAGTVATAAGEPIVGATVVAFPQELDVIQRLDDLLPRRNGAAKTADDGAFRVRLNDSTAILHDVVIHAPGFVAQYRESVPPGHTLRVALQPAPAASARLVDRGGDPVEGASIVASARLPVGVVIAPPGERRSDDDGAFDIPVVLRGLTVTLRVRADGYAPTTVTLSPETLALTPPASIVLIRGTPLRGRVLHAGTGDPLEGAEVVLGRQTGFVTRRRVNVRIREGGDAPVDAVRTDADGRFEFAAVPTESTARSAIGLTARFAGFVEARKRLTGQKSPGAIDVEFELRPVGTVRGRVIDERGAAVPHATVDATIHHGGATETDADGRYTLDVAGSRDGTRELTLVYRPPHGPESGALAYPRSEKRLGVRPLAGESIEVEDVVLPAPVAGPLARVRVVDERGDPVVGATVRSAGARAPWFTTDVDGRCVVVWHVDPVLLGPQIRGDDRVIAAEALGRAPARVRVTPRAGSPVDTELVLGAPHRVTGSVRTAEDRPLRGGYVNAVQEQAGEDAWWSAPIRDDGTFAIEGLPDGEFRIKVQWPPQLEVHRPMFDHSDRVRAGGRVRITMPPDPAGGSGRVVIRARDAETGAPVLSFAAGVVSPDEEYSTEARSRRVPAGLLVLPAVLARTLKMTVTSRGYLTHVRWIEVAGDGTLELDLALERGVPISGVVRGLDGASGKGRFLRLERVTQVHHDLGTLVGPHGHWIEDDLRYGLDSVRPGTYRVSLHGSGPGASLVTSPIGATVEIERGGDLSQLELLVAPAGRLRIAPAVDVLPSVEDVLRDGVDPDAQPAGRLVVVDPAGVVALDRTGLWRDWEVPFAGPAGTYTVTLHVAGAAPLTKQAKIVEGEETKLSFAPRGG